MSETSQSHLQKPWLQCPLPFESTQHPFICSSVCLVSSSVHYVWVYPAPIHLFLRLFILLQCPLPFESTLHPFICSSVCLVSSSVHYVWVYPAPIHLFLRLFILLQCPLPLSLPSTHSSVPPSVYSPPMSTPVWVYPAPIHLFLRLLSLLQCPLRLSLPSTHSSVPPSVYSPPMSTPFESTLHPFICSSVCLFSSNVHSLWVYPAPIHLFLRLFILLQFPLPFESTQHPFICSSVCLFSPSVHSLLSLPSTHSYVPPSAYSPPMSTPFWFYPAPIHMFLRLLILLQCPLPFDSTQHPFICSSVCLFSSNVHSLLSLPSTHSSVPPPVYSPPVSTPFWVYPAPIHLFLRLFILLQRPLPFESTQHPFICSSVCLFSSSAHSLLSLPSTHSSVPPSDYSPPMPTPFESTQHPFICSSVCLFSSSFHSLLSLPSTHSSVPPSVYSPPMSTPFWVYPAPIHLFLRLFILLQCPLPFESTQHPFICSSVCLFSFHFCSSVCLFSSNVHSLLSLPSTHSSVPPSAYSPPMSTPFESTQHPFICSSVCSFSSNVHSLWVYPAPIHLFLRLLFLLQCPLPLSLPSTHSSVPPSAYSPPMSTPFESTQHPFICSSVCLFSSNAHSLWVYPAPIHLFLRLLILLQCPLPLSLPSTHSSVPPSVYSPPMPTPFESTQHPFICSSVCLFSSNVHSLWVYPAPIHSSVCLFSSNVHSLLILPSTHSSVPPSAYSPPMSTPFWFYPAPIHLFLRLLILLQCPLPLSLPSTHSSVPPSAYSPPMSTPFWVYPAPIHLFLRLLFLLQCPLPFESTQHPFICSSVCSFSSNVHSLLSLPSTHSSVPPSAYSPPVSTTFESTQHPFICSSVCLFSSNVHSLLSLPSTHSSVPPSAYSPPVSTRLSLPSTHSSVPPSALSPPMSTPFWVYPAPIHLFLRLLFLLQCPLPFESTQHPFICSSVCLFSSNAHSLWVYPAPIHLFLRLIILLQCPLPFESTQHPLICSSVCLFSSNVHSLWVYPAPIHLFLHLLILLQCPLPLSLPSTHSSVPPSAYSHPMSTPFWVYSAPMHMFLRLLILLQCPLPLSLPSTHAFVPPSAYSPPMSTPFWVYPGPIHLFLRLSIFFQCPLPFESTQHPFICSPVCLFSSHVHSRWVYPAPIHLFLRLLILIQCPLPFESTQHPFICSSVCLFSSNVHSLLSVPSTHSSVPPSALSPPMSTPFWVYPAPIHLFLRLLFLLQCPLPFESTQHPFICSSVCLFSSNVHSFWVYPAPIHLFLRLLFLLQCPLPFESTQHPFICSSVCLFSSNVHSLLSLPSTHSSVPPSAYSPPMSTPFWVYPAPIHLFLRLLFLLQCPLPFESTQHPFICSSVCSFSSNVHSRLSLPCTHSSVPPSDYSHPMSTPFWVYPAPIHLFLRLLILLQCPLPFESTQHPFICSSVCSFSSNVHSLLSLPSTHSSVPPSALSPPMSTPFWVYPAPIHLFLRLFILLQCPLPLSLPSTHSSVPPSALSPPMSTPFWVYPAPIHLFLRLFILLQFPLPFESTQHPFICSSVCLFSSNVHSLWVYPAPIHLFLRLFILLQCPLPFESTQHPFICSSVCLFSSNAHSLWVYPAPIHLFLRLFILLQCPLPLSLPCTHSSVPPSVYSPPVFSSSAHWVYPAPIHLFPRLFILLQFPLPFESTQHPFICSPVCLFSSNVHSLLSLPSTHSSVPPSVYSPPVSTPFESTQHPFICSSVCLFSSSFHSLLSLPSTHSSVPPSVYSPPMSTPFWVYPAPIHLFLRLFILLQFPLPFESTQHPFICSPVCLFSSNVHSLLSLPSTHSSVPPSVYSPPVSTPFWVYPAPIHLFLRLLILIQCPLPFESTQHPFICSSICLFSSNVHSLLSLLSTHAYVPPSAYSPPMSTPFWVYPAPIHLFFRLRLLPFISA